MVLSWPRQSRSGQSYPLAYIWFPCGDHCLGTFDWLSVFLVFNPAARSAKQEYEQWLKNREVEKPVIDSFTNEFGS